MNPKQASARLMTIAQKINNSKNPDRKIVAKEVRSVLASIAGSTPVKIYSLYPDGETERTVIVDVTKLSDDYNDPTGGAGYEVVMIGVESGPPLTPDMKVSWVTDNNFKPLPEFASRLSEYMEPKLRQELQSY